MLDDFQPFCNLTYRKAATIQHAIYQIATHGKGPAAGALAPLDNASIRRMAYGLERS